VSPIYESLMERGPFVMMAACVESVLTEVDGAQSFIRLLGGYSPEGPDFERDLSDGFKNEGTFVAVIHSVGHPGLTIVISIVEGEETRLQEYTQYVPELPLGKTATIQLDLRKIPFKPDHQYRIELWAHGRLLSYVPWTTMSIQGPSLGDFAR
jgi:hypothetical protein